MRVGIVSDIHGNWTALQAVIRSMDELGVQVVLGCGDYLWTTTGDAHVVNWVREMAQHNHFVQGNGDTLAYYDRCKGLAWEDPSWMYDVVSSLPERLVVDLEGYRILIQHEWWPKGRFTGAALYDHLTQPPYVSPEVDLNGIDIAVFGDCHLPYHLVTSKTLLIHPGSVGAPFDTDPTRAKFAILDLASHEVLLTHHAAPFDVAAANQEIIQGRRVDIGHSYYRKMSEIRLRVTSPYSEFWEPIPRPVRWSKSRDD